MPFYSGDHLIRALIGYYYPWLALLELFIHALQSKGALVKYSMSIRLMHEKSGALFCIDPAGMAIKEDFAMSLVLRNDVDALGGEAAYPLIHVFLIAWVSISVEDNNRWP